MSNLDKNKPNNKFSAISSALGLSMITTTSAVTLHHFWRKRNNPNAQFSDYLLGVTNQLKRIEQANKSWLKTYQATDYQGFEASEQGLAQMQPQVQPVTKQSDTKQKVKWVSGVANKTIGAEFDNFSVVGIDKARQIVWQTQVPERVHDIVVQPAGVSLHLSQGKRANSKGVNLTENAMTVACKTERAVAVMGRRPSETFWIMDCATGAIIHTIYAQLNRHFYGHACYSLDGNWLYVAENNTATYEGMIGVYEVATGYRKTNEFTTHGIGPHELIIHPDGDKLIVANGGIKTDRASREELNLDCMKPSLVYLSLKQGEEGKVLQQVEPSHNQMSVRHISVINEGERKGTVAIGIQFQGEKHLNMPLVLTHKFGDDDFREYTPSNDWRQFHHYIASVIVNSTANLICATSPIGGCVSVFDMATQKMIDTVKIADCAGISTYQAGFIISDGQGGLSWLTVVENKLKVDTIQLPMAFDNHMQVVDC